MEEGTTSDSSSVEQVFFSTCAEFLSLNISEDLPLETGNSSQLLNSCGHPVVNMTAVSLHPARYAVLITYPILLAICTVGNITSFVVLSREPTKSVKRIYLMSLAFSDFFFMWAQFFPYLSNYSAVTKNAGLKLFINQIAGGCTFLQEMLITSSDWILLAFSLERFFAVVYPLYYNIFVSKKRAKAVVVVIFILAALYSLFNLFDYYWFFFNDDPRCPAVLMRPPAYIATWHEVYEWAVLIVPVVTFLVIFSVNVVVSVHLVRHRKFRNTNTLRGSSQNALKDNQAIHMLLGCAVLYILTQFPGFVYNILQLTQHYPFCNFTFTDNFVAQYSRAIGVTTNINYSVNFLLYYGVSTTFRQGLRDLRHSLRQTTLQYRRHSFFENPTHGTGAGKAAGQLTNAYGLGQPYRSSLESCTSNTTTTSAGSKFKNNN